MIATARQEAPGEHPAVPRKRRKPCSHADSFLMPGVPGRKTALCRCRTCNRDFDYDTGLLVAYVDGAYRYRSNRRPVL